MPQNQLQVQEPKNNYLIEFTNEQYEIIKAQYFPPIATPLEIDYCFNVAKSLGLNPLLNEIYFVERKSFNNGQWITKIEPLAGRNAFRKIANKSGDLESIKVDVMLKDTPKLVNGEWVEGKDLVAVCEIRKRGFNSPFIVEVEYSEYVQKKKDGTPTKFWSEKPKTMLKKVAESQCLKMAFDISGLYDENEMPTEEPQLQHYANDKLKKIAQPKPKRRTPTKKELEAETFLHETAKHDIEKVDKPDMSFLDNVNTDGTDKEEDEVF